MIGKDTLNKLDYLGIGADIDRLESFVVDCKQASSVAYLSICKRDIELATELLRKFRGNSVAFDLSTDIKEVDDGCDNRLIKKFNNKHLDILYKNNNFTELHSENIKITEVMIGVDIEITFLDGKLQKIYVIGNSTRYYDITNRLFMMNKIKEWAGTGEISVRGVLIKDKASELDIIHDIRINKKLDGYSFIAYKAYSDNGEIELVDMFEQPREFRSIKEIEVRDGVYGYSIEDKFIYKYDWYDSTIEYEGEVISGSSEKLAYGEELVINIKDTDGINKVHCEDIMTIIDNDINIGDKIKFRVYMDKAILNT